MEGQSQKEIDCIDKYMVSLLAITFIVFSPFLSFSQPFLDVINIKHQRFPSVRYIEGKKQVRINQINWNVTLPLPLKNKGFFIIGAVYDQYQFSTSEYQTRSLYSFILPIGYVKQYKSATKWKTLFMLLPRISSDRFSFSRDGYQQGALIISTYKKKNTLKYKFGLYYNREFFGNFFVPLVGIEWTPSPRVNIFGVIPMNMSLEYKCSEKWFLGFTYQSVLTSYRLHQNVEKSYILNGDRFWGHNQFRNFINYYITKNIVFFIEAGYTFGRQFQAFESKKVRTEHPVFSKIREGFLVNSGMAFRIRL